MIDPGTLEFVFRVGVFYHIVVQLLFDNCLGYKLAEVQYEVYQDSLSASLSPLKPVFLHSTV